jgi:hypothetical protein
MKKIFLLIVLITLSLNSCDRESNGGVDFIPENTNFNFDSRLPESFQSNPEISARMGQMQSITNVCGALMNSMRSSRVTVLNRNSNHSSKNSHLTNNYTWVYGSYVVVYSFGIVGDNYEFEYTINLNGNPFYEASGYQAVDGSSGHWEANFSNGIDYNVVYDWSINSAGDIHIESVFTLGSDTLNYEFNLNSDNSGDLTYKLNSVILFEMSWNSLGHGSYILNGEVFGF